MGAVHPFLLIRKILIPYRQRLSINEGVSKLQAKRYRRGPLAPVSEGDTRTVKIEAKGKSGDGLARIEGFVVFVPGVNVGDEVKVRITSVRRRFATAEVVRE
ncbi:MAG: TRAM domain-containing protein [Hadesarchaea archaeon]|nr:TRAM domain-containing protein [Hadesarchaea archaeon]